MTITDNIFLLKNEIPDSVKIIAVSKTKPVSMIKEAYDAGQYIFGENKVQELSEKQPQLPENIEWHLIGHLQTNKVKYIIPFVSLIHSVDSMKLLYEINKEAAKINRVVDCLIQIRIAKEETKFGMSFSEADKIFGSSEFKDLNNVRTLGLMGMASFTDNAKQIKSEFLLLADYFKQLKNSWFLNNSAFKELSMGMSGDYKLAIEAGSTMVRIGSLIFGDRIYNQ